jgi:zinc ribbon protein
VVRCPYCGEAVRPDAQVCPRCQSPLAAQQGYGYQQGGYQQPAEANLPDWVRQMQSPSSASPFGAPDGYGAPAGPGSMAGGSLINEDALPSWLRGGNGGAPVGSPSAFGQSNAGWAVPPMPGAGQGYAQPPLSGYPQQDYQQGGYPQAQQPWPQQGPANPFDEAALPSWLTQAAGQSYAQPGTGAYGTGTYGTNAYSTNQYPTGAYDGQQGFGAGAYAPGGPPSAFPSAAYPGMGGQLGGQLGGQGAAQGYDNQGLPSWMNPATAGAQANGSGNARDGMPASSLIDEQSLPSWLRGGNGAGQAGARPGEEPLPSWLTQMTGGAPAYAPPAAPAGPQNGWQPAPAPRMGVASVPANQMVDDAALPDWLRAAGAGASYGAAAQPPAFSAGQLVDPSALPGWARDQAGGQPRGQQGARAGNSDWLTDSRIPAAGRNGGVKSAWLRDNPPENPLGTEEMPSWMRAGRGQGEQRRPRGQRQDPGDAMDTRARSVRSGRARSQDYDDYDGYDGYEQQGNGAGYEDDDERSNGRKRGGFFGFFGRK